jgi:sulfotransferase family protein
MNHSRDHVEAAIRIFHDLWRTRAIDRLRLPNLVGVGSGRCGTTLLYGLLQAQPDIYMTPVKEANFFGSAAQRSDEGALREYRLLFAGQQNENYIGEITPTYLTTLPSLQQIRSVLGDIKLVITLRDPVMRLISHFKHHRAAHKCGSIEHYLEVALVQHEEDPTNTGWTRPQQGIRYSMYSDGIAQVKSMFSPRNILVLFYEDLHEGPDKWVSMLSEFLETEVICALDVNKFRNGSDREALEFPSSKVGEQVRALFERDVYVLQNELGIAQHPRWTITL